MIVVPGKNVRRCDAFAETKLPCARLKKQYVLAFPTNRPRQCPPLYFMLLVLGKSKCKGKAFIASQNTIYELEKTLESHLSSDHRVVDGAVAAMWGQEFKKFIENPELMLL